MLRAIDKFVDVTNSYGTHIVHHTTHFTLYKSRSIPFSVCAICIIFCVLPYIISRWFVVASFASLRLRNLDIMLVYYAIAV